MDGFGVYILKSRRNGRYYIGSTDNICRRIQEHIDGKVAATKNTRPFKLAAFIPCKTRIIAWQAEYRLKKYKRRDILEEVIKDKLFPWEYKDRTGPVV